MRHKYRKTQGFKRKRKDRAFKAMHEGDETAREKMVNGNLRLVLSVIQRFSGRNGNPDDLFQVGTIH